ncbi:hypothetical protein Tco_0439884 [Tanacetum coccineum]
MVVRITEHGYYWSSMHRDAAKMIQDYEKCKEKSAIRKIAENGVITARTIIPISENNVAKHDRGRIKKVNKRRESKEVALIEEAYYRNKLRRIFVRDKMSRDVIMVGSTMWIPFLYRGEYSQWCERFMNYLEEQTDGEAMINSIQNGNHPLPLLLIKYHLSELHDAIPTLKDPIFWTVEVEKDLER